MAFSIWRSLIVYKMRLINPLQQKGVREFKAARNVNQNKNAKVGRPSVMKSSITSSQLILRYVDSSDLSV
jgi:hypothetical protein